MTMKTNGNISERQERSKYNGLFTEHYDIKS